MSIHQRLTAFAITEARWITWLLVGFSIGGVAVLFERAVYLITASAAFGRLKVRLRVGLGDAARGGSAPAREGQAGATVRCIGRA